jgi:sporulation protein YlmC with PRC-barrel domain
MRKLMIPVALCVIAGLAPIRPNVAQVAGTARLGVTVEEMKLVVIGWPVKKKMLGTEVYNDKNEKIGKIEDVIVSTDGKVSWAIIGVGGFLGVGKHDVAIPMDQLKLTGAKYILNGASKEALKKLPKFEYA